MPKIDFNNVSDAQDFSPLPPARYLCRVDRVEEARSQAGHEMWNLTLKVENHEKSSGRLIFDRLVFCNEAMSRVKLACSRMGLPTSGVVDLKPSDLKGRLVLVDTTVEEYTDREGRSKRRNAVPFAGYHRVEAGTEQASSSPPAANDVFSEANLPF